MGNCRDTYDIDGSVIADVLTAYNNETIAALEVDDATVSRLDPYYLVHASLDNMSWLLSSTGLH